MGMLCRMPASMCPELSSEAESLKVDDFLQMCLYKKRCALKRHAEPSRKYLERVVLDPIRAEKNVGTTDLLCAQATDL